MYRFCSNLIIIPPYLMTTQKQILIASVIAILLTSGALYYYGSEIHSQSLTVEEEPNACIARSTIISRAQNWIDRHIGYDIGEVDGYRTDCSGYVSMAWQLGTSKTTQTLHEVSTNITKGELQPGDAIVCPGRHAVLFAGWANNTHFICMEEGDKETGSNKRTVPYPYWPSIPSSCFQPMRYKNVC